MPEHDSMIGPSEEAAALDQTVGEGTPDTAPERDATYGAPLAHPTDHDEDEEEGTMVNPVGGGPRAVHATEMQPGKLSPKAALAFLLPALSTLILAILDQVVDPSLDPTLKVAIVGAVNALLGLLGAYVGRPGDVVIGS
jgi:hypothetical protein